MEINEIYLRAFEPEDYKTTIHWRKDEGIWSMLGGVKYFVSETYEKQWIENAIKDSNNIRLAVCLKENNLHIGNVYITDINLQNRSGISHVLIGNRNYWGKGLATKAYKLLLDYAFKERNFHRIVAHVLEDNVSSIKLHLKCGYKQEGIFRHSVFKNGQWKNQIQFAILEDDYFS
ncbi:MAG: GNAT family protein [Bacteroidota bacterium]|nr:GNAT family protein [Bacteroidota bacterium]